MLFYISFKFSILSILRSKFFLLIVGASILLIILVNLIFGLLINSNEKVANIFWLDYINLVLIIVLPSFIALSFTYDFFYLQKKSGIRTIEFKNGMKVWQMFFSKLLALVLVVLSFSIIITTIAVVETSIIFIENKYVSKLIFVNLYLICLIPLFLLSLNLLVLCLNWKKITLIFAGFLLGVLSLFYLVNNGLYDLEKKVIMQGDNRLAVSNYKVYFNYYIHNFKKQIKEENKFLEDLKFYGEDSEKMQELIFYDDLDKLESKEMKRYYNSFRTSNSFYRSGGLFQDIDLFNLVNKEYLMDENNYIEAKYNKELINESLLFQELHKFDIEKTNLDFFEHLNAIDKPISILKETKKYIYQLENYFKSNEQLNNYYEDLKKINKLILDIYEKGFYFQNETFFLFSWISWNGQELAVFFKDTFDDSRDIKEKRKKVFDLQTISSGKSIYQGILFYIINNYNEDKIVNVYDPNNYVLGFWKMLNYYTSPFLWLEFFSKFGFMEKTFDNVVTIYSSGFYKTHNFVKVDFEKDKSERYKIYDYYYKGPNTALIVSLIILYSAILIALGFLFYKINFYK